MRFLRSSDVINQSIYNNITFKEFLSTTDAIRSSIRKQRRINLQIKLIRKILKKDMRISYIKRRPRPMNLDPSKQLYLESLFSIHVTRKFSDIKLLKNIDESLFSRSMRNNYTWAEKGGKAAIKNIRFSG